MAGISISELISKDDTTNVADGFIPISINNNTFKIKAATFLNDTNNCINTFVTKVQEQSATIEQCITNTNELCASIECNNTTINNLFGNTQNIYNCVTELSGCIAAASSITDLNVVADNITNLNSSVENIRTRFTTLSSFTDNINNEVLARGSATAVDNLINRVNALDSCVANEATCITSLSGQICALDVAGNACSFNGLEQRIIKNETFIENDAVKKCTLDGCISEIDGKLDAKASVESRDSILSRLATTEGVATGAAGDVVTINNCISEIDGQVNAKANTTQVNALVASVETAQNTANAAQNSITSLQTQITNLDVGSQAQKIDQLTTSISNADTAITNLQLKDQSIDSCISCVDGCVSSYNSDISTLNTKVNGSGSGSIQATCTIAVAACDAATTINTKYGVRLNANGAIAGFGLIAGSNTSTGCGFSKFCIQSNCFVIASQNDCTKACPFTIVDNCVRMCGAFIQDLSVCTLQIKDQAVTTQAIAVGSNKKYSCKATHKPGIAAVGTYQDIATGSIVSTGEPIVVTFGFGGEREKTALTPNISETTAHSSRAQKRGIDFFTLQQTQYKYGYEVRVVRTQGSKTLAGSTDGTSFIDRNPGTGTRTYKLQARFCRRYPNCLVSRSIFICSCGVRNQSSERRICFISTNLKTALMCNTRLYDLAQGNSSPPTGKKGADTYKRNRSKQFRSSGGTGSPSTQTITIESPFIEIRQTKK